MGLACQAATKRMCFCALFITHSVAVMVLALAFYTEDPNGVGDEINVFLFPELSPSAGSKATLPTQRWDVVLGGNNFTSFANTSTLLGSIDGHYPFFITLEIW